MSTHIDIEHAIKAEHAADFLMSDLIDLHRSENPLVADFALEQMSKLRPIIEALQHLQASLEILKAREG